MAQETHSTGSASRALELVRRLIGQFGPRPAGSDASRGCAAALKEEAAAFADRTSLETFPVHPGAFLGWIRVLVVIYVLSVAGLWLEIPLVSALLVTAGLAIMLFQFFLYRETLDRFYPRRTGTNVLATLEPEGAVHGELILSGHHDSARVFTFLVHQPALYAVRVYGGIGSLVGLAAVSWALTVQALVAGDVTGGFRPETLPGWGIVATIVFTVLVLLVGQLWWFASSHHTEGAGDNLASTAAALEALRELARRREEGSPLRHLRVTAASWGAEEAGLRGSRAWRRAHGDAASACPIWNLNLECLYDPADFFMLTSDINGSVQLSGELANRCAALLERAGHANIPTRPIAFLTGGTDAAETARAGARATTLMGMPWGNTERNAVYHTPADTVDSVSTEAVAAAIRLATDLAAELDTELATELAGGA